MTAPRSQVTERLGISIRTPFVESVGDRDFEGGIVRLNPAKDHRIADRKFKCDIITKFETQAFTNLFRNSDLTFG